MEEAHSVSSHSLRALCSMIVGYAMTRSGGMCLSAAKSCVTTLVAKAQGRFNLPQGESTAPQLRGTWTSLLFETRSEVRFRISKFVINRSSKTWLLDAVPDAVWNCGQKMVRRSSAERVHNPLGELMLELFHGRNVSQKLMDE